jgi:hypothetical protein
MKLNGIPKKEIVEFNEKPEKVAEIKIKAKIAEHAFQYDYWYKKQEPIKEQIIKIRPPEYVSEYACKKQREEQIKSNIEKNSVQLKDYAMETIFLGGPLHREQKLMDNFTLDGLKDYSPYANRFYTCYTCKNEINLLFMLHKTPNMYSLFLAILCRKCDMVFCDTIQLKYDGE